MSSETEPTDRPDPVDVPITGDLDLHGFAPRDLGSLIPEYLTLCRQRGILEVRLAHGKGRGQVMRSVHALLGRDPGVESFSLATPAWGGHGATVVRLKPAVPGQTLN